MTTKTADRTHPDTHAAEPRNPRSPGMAASRLLREGYGPGAWHGPDLKAALTDVTPRLAFWRPAPGRHNIAELGLHHAYVLRGVRSQLSGEPPEPFVLGGEDWFELEDKGALPWPKVLATVEAEHQRLERVAAAIEAGTSTPGVPDDEWRALVLGATCHAVYHAGQIQLIKRLKR